MNSDTPTESSGTQISRIVRLDERTQHISKAMLSLERRIEERYKEEREEARAQFAEIHTRIGQRRQQDHNELQESFRKLQAEIEGRVSQEQFRPVQTIAFGLVGAVLFAVLAALLGLIIPQ